MRTTPTSEAIEALLRAVFEGTASDGPWVEHNGAAWEMQELAYDAARDVTLPYQSLLLTLASDRTRAFTRDAVVAVREAADQLLALLECYERAAGEKQVELERQASKETTCVGQKMGHDA
jgi:hypothetical protein